MKRETLSWDIYKRKNRRFDAAIVAAPTERRKERFIREPEPVTSIFKRERRRLVK